MKNKKKIKLEKRLKEVENNLSFYINWNLPLGKDYENLVKAKYNLERKLKGA